MNKEEILNYVMHTPENTNIRVLSDMIDQLQTSGGGANVTIVNVTEEGTVWTCENTWQEIYDAFLTGPVILNLPISGEQDANIASVICVSYCEVHYYAHGMYMITSF